MFRFKASSYSFVASGSQSLASGVDFGPLGVDLWSPGLDYGIFGVNLSFFLRVLVPKMDSRAKIDLTLKPISRDLKSIIRC